MDAQDYVIEALQKPRRLFAVALEHANDDCGGLKPGSSQDQRPSMGELAEAILGARNMASSDWHEAAQLVPDEPHFDEMEDFVEHAQAFVGRRGLVSLEDMLETERNMVEIAQAQGKTRHHKKRSLGHAWPMRVAKLGGTTRSTGASSGTSMRTNCAGPSSEKSSSTGPRPRSSVSSALYATRRWPCLARMRRPAPPHCPASLISGRWSGTGRLRP